MTNSDPSTYRSCQSLVKGLDLLASLNRFPSGSATITDLTRQTGIHRTTIKRLLETLRAQGYVESDPTTNLYRLAFRVQRLSYGFRDNVSITEIAWPIMRTLSKDVVWPCSLLSPEGDEMVVRISTRLYSRLSFHPGMPGRKLPFLTTAAGRAYISSISIQEREMILEMLASRHDDDGRLARDVKWVDNLIDQTIARGYAVNLGEWESEPKFGGISVPLQHQGETIACLNVIFLLRAVMEKDSLRKIASSLIAARSEIESRFAEKCKA